MIEHVVTLIGNIAWPITTLFILFIFKQDIRDLFEKMQSANIAGFEFRAEERIEEVVIETAKLTDESDVILLSKDDEQVDKYSLLLKISKNIQDMIKRISIDKGFILEENKEKAPIPWLLQKIRFENPEIRSELETASKILSTSVTTSSGDSTVGIFAKHLDRPGSDEDINS